MKAENNTWCVIFDHSYTSQASWNQFHNPGFQGIQEDKTQDEIDGINKNGAFEEYFNRQGTLSFVEECMGEEGVSKEMKTKIEIVGDTVIKEEMEDFANISEVSFEEYVNNTSPPSCVRVGYQNSFEKYVNDKIDLDEKRMINTMRSSLYSNTAPNCVNNNHKKQNSELQTANVQELPKEPVNFSPECTIKEKEQIEENNLVPRLAAREMEIVRLKTQLKWLVDQRRLDYMKLLAAQIKAREREHLCTSLSKKLDGVAVKFNLQAAELAKTRQVVSLLTKSGRCKLKFVSKPNVEQRKFAGEKQRVKKFEMSSFRKGKKQLLVRDNRLKEMREELDKLKAYLKVDCA